MQQSLADLLKSPEIEALFEDVTRGKPKARKTLAERLADLPLTYPKCVAPSFYQRHEPDLRQDFLIKILEGKVLWDKNKYKLTTYVGTIVNNMWIDCLRQSKRKPCDRQTADESPQTADESPQTADESPQTDLQNKRLRPEFAGQLVVLSCSERIILKISMPYLCACQFDADETSILQEKFGVDASLLPPQMMQKLYARSKRCVDPEWIAQLLQTKRNTVDQTLHRIYKKLPWLKGDLRDVLE